MNKSSQIWYTECNTADYSLVEVTGYKPIERLKPSLDIVLINFTIIH